MTTVTRRTPAIPPQIFRRLEAHLLSDTFPWFYTPSIAYDPGVNTSKDTQEHCFIHLVSNAGQSNSPIAELMDTIAVTALSQEHPDQMIHIERIRIGLILSSPQPIVHAPHVDQDDPRYRHALIYLTTSDGDTHLYNEHYDVNSGLSSYDYYRQRLNSQVTIEQKITPQANTMITFPGTQYHSSSAPRDTSRRIAININYWLGV